MQKFFLALIFAAFLAVAHAANGMRLTVSDQKLFLAAAATSQCATDAALVVNYQLTKAKTAYVSSNTANLENNACGNELKKIQAGTGLRAVTKFETLTNANLDLICETKCGGPKCLCEVGMTCTPSTGDAAANPCEVIADCKTDKCVAKTAQLTTITYSFPLVGTETEQDRFQKAFRDAISKFGVDSHCWLTPYVFDVPLTKRKDKWSISILDNTSTKRGCGSVEFAFPPSLIPKTTSPIDEDTVTVKLEAKTNQITLECLDQTTNLLICSAACHAPCPAYSSCQTNEDCVFGGCKTQKDADGKDMAEKRCASAVVSSVISALLITLLAFFF